jgi:mono/diheme cytochrome c family protein
LDGGGEGSDDSASDVTACPTFDADFDDPTVVAGRMLATQHKCSNCHGSGLTGNDTAIDDAGSVYPRNLTPDPTTGLGCWTARQIAGAILDGIDNAGQTLCVVPHFRTQVGEAGIELRSARQV